VNRDTKLETSARRRLPLAAVALVVAVILALTLLPSEEEKLAPMLSCLLCGERGLADVILNVLLFVPFGVALELRGERLLRASLVAAALSAGIEFAQLFVPGRDTSLSDVLSNTAGAAAGWLLVYRGLRVVDVSAPTPLRAVIVAASLPALAVAATAILLRPALPRSTYFGQWTPNLGHLEWYPGRVLHASLGPLALPSGHLDNSDSVRALLLAGAPLTVRATGAPLVSGLAPLVSVADWESREIVLLGVSRNDLVFRYRTRAAAVRLNQPDLVASGVVRSLRRRDTLVVAAWREPAGYCLAFNEARTCRLNFSAGRGWALLLYPSTWPLSLKHLMDAGWVAVLFVPIGFSAVSRRPVWWGGALGVSFWVLPALLGVAPTSWDEWLGAALGIGIGARLRTMVKREQGALRSDSRASGGGD
jgi:VanZ family protein